MHHTSRFVSIYIPPQHAMHISIAHNNVMKCMWRLNHGMTISDPLLLEPVYSISLRQLTKTAMTELSSVNHCAHCEKLFGEL